MLEIFAKTGLFFSQTPTIAVILIVGLCSKYRQSFVRCLYLLCFTMIYNVLLKSLFHVPLPSHLEGFALPSGHMHSAVVFWGWLAVEFHKVWFYEIVSFMLILVGYGLVYQGYHYPSDVLASVGFGILSIIIFALINHLRFFKNRSERLGLLMTLLGLVIFFILPQEMRKPHVKVALLILGSATILSILGCYIKQHFPKRTGQKQ